MDAGLNSYESLVNTTGNEYLNQDIEALEIQIIALQVEEKRNYKLDGSKQMDNGYIPTNDYDLITLKFFLEHNIITMSFLRTDGGNAMLADITMESVNEIDINGCRAISNQNSESKVNYQTFDYRTILQNGYYNGNTVNDWVGNNSIVISHKDGKITINEATIDFSNNQLVNINQINNITAAEVETLAGSDTSTTLQTQINNGMTEIGNLTAEVLNLDNEVKTLQDTALIKGYNRFEADLTIMTENNHNMLLECFNGGTISLAGNVSVGTQYLNTGIHGGLIDIISNTHTAFISYPNGTSDSPLFSVDHTGGIRLKSYRNNFGLEYGYISNECKDFYKTVHNDESQTITGNKTVTVGHNFVQDSKALTFNTINNILLNSTNGAVDFKVPLGHFHVDAKNINLVSNEDVEIESTNDIKITSSTGNVNVNPTIGNINLLSNDKIQIEGRHNVNLSSTVADVIINTPIGNINIDSSGQLDIKAFSQINLNTIGIINLQGDGATEVKSNSLVNISAPDITINSTNNHLLFGVNTFYRDIANYLSFFQVQSINYLEDVNSNMVSITNKVWVLFNFHDAWLHWNYPSKIIRDPVAALTYDFANVDEPNYKGGFFNLPRTKYILTTSFNCKYLANSNRGLVLFRWAIYDIATNEMYDSSNHFIMSSSNGADSWDYGNASNVWAFDTSPIPSSGFYKVVLEHMGTHSNTGTTFNIVPDFTVTLRGVDF